MYLLSVFANLFKAHDTGEREGDALSLSNNWTRGFAVIPHELGSL